MSLEKSLKLKGMSSIYPIIQGGMGVGISCPELSIAVQEEGGLGILSSVALRTLRSRREGKNLSQLEATAREVDEVKQKTGYVGINIMVALPFSYDASVIGAIKGGVNVIISGAGLPLGLPKLIKKYASNNQDISLVPIISSARALDLICKKWGKEGMRPDAVVLEGPLAGGHLGFRYDELEKPDFYPEHELITKLLPPVLGVANKYRIDSNTPIPVIVAGGIYTNKDIQAAIDAGASGVQMGTRFAATVESGGTKEFKRVYVLSKKEDVTVATTHWGSPCGLPFRYLKTSLLALNNEINNDETNSFCICSTLLGACGVDNSYKLENPKLKDCPEGLVLRKKGERCSAYGKASYAPLVTCGENVYKIDKIIPVKKLMDELKG